MAGVVVTVVIPSWNGRHLLCPCLQAVKRQSFTDYEVVVVDNGSIDGTASWLEKECPWVRVIRTSKNIGFAAAVNLGISESHSRYVATLNNDTEVAPGWLAALVEVAENDHQVGMCASTMLFADRPQMINSAGISVDRVGIAWDRLGGAEFDNEESKLMEVFGACAGAALYRRAMLDSIGCFDVDFFAYLEDVDLAWRARAAGWDCVYVPQARVLHRHSATGGEGSPFKSFHLGRNKVWLIVKNYPFRELYGYVPLILIYDLAAVTYALLARLDVYALLGRLAGLAGAIGMWRKRAQCSGSPSLTTAFLSPLSWPWRIPNRYRHIQAR